MAVKGTCNPKSVCSLTLCLFISCKLWTYAGIRFLYPMSQFLANDWNLSSTEMSAVLAVGEFVPAGFFSSCGDIVGPFKLAIGSFFVLSISSFLMLLPPVFASLLVFRFCFGFGLFLFMVAAQTAATMQVSNDSRDCVTGLLEIPYSASILVVVPVLSIAYENLGWRAPFWILAVFICAHLPFLIYSGFLGKRGQVKSSKSSQVGLGEDDRTTTDTGSQFERDEPKSTNDDDIDNLVRPTADVEHDEASKRDGDDGELHQQAIRASNSPTRLGLRAGLQWSTGALAFNVSGLCLSVAINLLSTEFGFLLHSFYGLDEGDAGTAALAMGVAELSGVLLTTVNFGAGSLPMEIAGILLVLFILVLVFLGTMNLVACLIGLFVVFLLGEFNTVQRLSRAPLFASHVDASAMLGSQVQFQVIGRTIGAAIAAQLFFQPDNNMKLGHTLCCIIAGSCAIVMCIFTRVAATLKAKCDQSQRAEYAGVTHGVA